MFTLCYITCDYDVFLAFAHKSRRILQLFTSTNQSIFVREIRHRDVIRQTSNAKCNLNPGARYKKNEKDKRRKVNQARTSRRWNAGKKKIVALI